MRALLLDPTDDPSLREALTAATGSPPAVAREVEAARALLTEQELDLVIDARPEIDGALYSGRSLPILICLGPAPAAGGAPPSGRGGRAADDTFWCPRDPASLGAAAALALALAAQRRQASSGPPTPQRITHWLLDTAPVAIGVRQIKGDDFIHILDNQRSAAMWDKRPEELRGLTDRELGVRPELIDMVMARYAEARAENRAVDFEFDFSGPERQQVVRGKLAPMRMDGSKTEYMAFVAEDVAEMRKLEARLLEADHLASVGSLAASIGHEIKNPASLVLLHLTNALDLVAELAEGGEALAEDSRDELEAALEGATTGVRRISALVNDLQALARSPDTGVRPVQLRSVVDSVLALVGAKLRTRADLRHEYREGPMVQANAVRLAQVVLAMLRDAHDRLDPDTVPDNRITVRTRPEGQAIAVEVIARGPHRTGTGAGASTSGTPWQRSCEQLVASYGGRMGTGEEPDGATRRWFEIPAILPALPAEG